jgi:hypothetical protein
MNGTNYLSLVLEGTSRFLLVINGTLDLDQRRRGGPFGVARLPFYYPTALVSYRTHTQLYSC